MRPNLLNPDRGVDTPLRMPPNRTMLVEDLDLTVLYTAMAAGDSYLFDIAKQVVPAGLTELEAITYRQHVLADCLRHHQIVRQLYDLATDAAEPGRATSYAGLTFRDPEAILHRSIEGLDVLTKNLHELRGLAERHSGDFESDGFTRLFAMLSDQLDDGYLTRIGNDLAELRFSHGLLLSAALGTGNKGTHYLLHPQPRLSRRERLTGTRGASVGFRVPDSDDEGYRALARLAGRGINPVATALEESADHVQGFFARLRAELGFYLGCINLYERLAAASVATCFPRASVGNPALACRDLRDVGLCLTAKTPVIGNDIDADGKTLIMITGANSGGKSTFLRSVGAAYVMMQAGMFVTAQAFTADIRDGIFTHYKREEDQTLTQGKLGEELARMRDIIDALGPKSLLLCNESFATTNEREGSQIARHIIEALTDNGVKTVFVTHLYDLAQTRYLRKQPTDLFLRAEPDADGTRSYRLDEAQPQPTSHGEDAYNNVFTR